MLKTIKNYFKNFGEDICNFADKRPVWFGLTAAAWSVYLVIVGGHLVTGKKWDLVEVEDKK